MTWDPDEDRYSLDDAWLMGQRVTVMLLRYIIREELYRLNLITQEQRDEVAKRLEVE